METRKATELLPITPQSKPPTTLSTRLMMYRIHKMAHPGQLPACDTVPNWIKEITKKQFETTQQEPVRGFYTCRGKAYYDYDIDTQGYLVNSTRLINALVAKIPNGCIKILDIGSGNNLFAKELNKNPRIRAAGISAADYRPHNEQDKKDETYIVDNIDHLPNHIDINSCDAIFSKMTFRHLENPAKTLIDCYRALKAGGILVVDRIKFPGLENYLKHMISFLKSQGYEVTAHYGYDIFNHHMVLNFFSIIKTKEELILPIEYDKKNEPIVYLPNNTVSYVPNNALKKYSENIHGERKPISLLQIKENLKTRVASAKNLGEWLNKIKEYVREILPQLEELNLVNQGKVDFNWGKLINSSYKYKLNIFSQQGFDWPSDPQRAFEIFISLIACQLQIEAECLDFVNFFRKHLKTVIKTSEEDDFPQLPYDLLQKFIVSDKPVQQTKPALSVALR